MQKGFDITNLYYSDDAYRYLSKWLQLGGHAWENSLNDLLKDIKSIHPNLIGFLKIEGIESIWSKIQIFENLSFFRPSVICSSPQVQCAPCSAASLNA